MLICCEVARFRAFTANGESSLRFGDGRMLYLQRRRNPIGVGLWGLGIWKGTKKRKEGRIKYSARRRFYICDRL